MNLSSNCIKYFKPFGYINLLGKILTKPLSLNSELESCSSRDKAKLVIISTFYNILSAFIILYFLQIWFKIDLLKSIIIALIFTTLGSIVLNIKVGIIGGFIGGLAAGLSSIWVSAVAIGIILGITYGYKMHPVKGIIVSFVIGIITGIAYVIKGGVTYEIFLYGFILYGFSIGLKIAIGYILVITRLWQYPFYLLVKELDKNPLFTDEGIGWVPFLPFILQKIKNRNGIKAIETQVAKLKDKLYNSFYFFQLQQAFEIIILNEFLNTKNYNDLIRLTDELDLPLLRRLLVGDLQSLVDLAYTINYDKSKLKETIETIESLKNELNNNILMKIYNNWLTILKKEVNSNKK